MIFSAMRVLYPVIILLFISWLPTQTVQGQDQFSATVTTSARVVHSIELITIKTLTIGSLQPGQVEIYVNPINNVNAGFMIAQGIPGAEFRLNYLPQRELSQIDGDGTLFFNYEISGNSVENQSTSEILEYDNRNLEFNEEGKYYIWVGGRINLENAAPGNYEGDFTIEIDYI